jgi:uncharacterized protein
MATAITAMSKVLHMGFWNTCLQKACVISGVFCISSAVAEGPPSFRVQSLKEIREEGVVMQRWETSCAAAALATVLTYGFHDPVSERYAAAKMLEKTEPTKVKARGGFSMLDMKQFVEGLGYNGDAYQYLSIEDLKAFRAPIVPINLYGYNHYVVLNALNDREVLLADPAFGNRSMRIEQFKKIWMDGFAFVVTRK